MKENIKSIFASVADICRDLVRRALAFPRTPGNVLTAAILIIGAVITILRFTCGLGTVTNLDDSNPWGIWIGFDLLCLLGGQPVFDHGVGAVQALQNQYGVDPSRLTAAGRGEYNPIADNTSAAGKQRNRRTQIIITPKLDQFMDLIEKAPETEGEQIQ